MSLTLAWAGCLRDRDAYPDARRSVLAEHPSNTVWSPARATIRPCTLFEAGVMLERLAVVAESHFGVRSRRSVTTAAQILSKQADLCQHRAGSGRKRPNLNPDGIWCKLARTSIEIWPNLPYLGQFRPNSANLSREPTNSGPTLGKFGPEWTNFGPTSIDVGPTSANFHQIWPGIG